MLRLGCRLEHQPALAGAGLRVPAQYRSRVGLCRVPASIDKALQTVLTRIMTRTMKRLTCRRVRGEVERSTCVAVNDADWDEVRNVSSSAGISMAPPAAVG